MSRTLAEIRAARLRAELQEAKAAKPKKSEDACCEPCAETGGSCSTDHKHKKESVERPDYVQRCVGALCSVNPDTPIDEAVSVCQAQMRAESLTQRIVGAVLRA